MKARTLNRSCTCCCHWSSLDFSPCQGVSAQTKISIANLIVSSSTSRSGCTRAGALSPTWIVTEILIVEDAPGGSGDIPFGYRRPARLGGGGRRTLKLLATLDAAREPVISCRRDIKTPDVLRGKRVGSTG